MDILYFIINSILLGVGLAMDAFSVSMANGLKDVNMKKADRIKIAFMFALFQCIMPLIGWFFVHTLISVFKQLQVFIPWVALILLLFIGIKMIYEALTKKEEEAAGGKLTFSILILQAVATSIDALSVGFTIADYNVIMALICALIIAAVTFVICIVGVRIGTRFGMKLSGKAEVVGGVILILIGLEIFIKGIFF